MTTATAAKPRKTTSPRYPGWTIERVSAKEYRMTRPGSVFAIGVGHSDDHGWTGKLMTMQRRSGDQTRGWEPARTPFRHSVIGCVAEVERREKTIAKYAAKALTK
jgi:hypothetical protein